MAALLELEDYFYLFLLFCFYCYISPIFVLLLFITIFCYNSSFSIWTKGFENFLWGEASLNYCGAKAGELWKVTFGEATLIELLFYWLFILPWTIGILAWSYLFTVLRFCFYFYLFRFSLSFWSFLFFFFFLSTVS